MMVSVINKSIQKFMYLQHKQTFKNPKNTFDIIHTNYIFSDGILAYLLSRKYKVPYLINTHNEIFYFQHALSSFLAKRILNAASYVLPLNYSNYLYFKAIGIRNLEHTALGFNKAFLKIQKDASDIRGAAQNRLIKHQENQLAELQQKAEQAERETELIKSSWPLKVMRKLGFAK